MLEFSRERARLLGPDWFPRFVAAARPEKLQRHASQTDSRVMVAERHGSRRAYWLDQITYHHVAQGVLGGEPFLVSF